MPLLSTDSKSRLWSTAKYVGTFAVFVVLIDFLQFAYQWGQRNNAHLYSLHHPWIIIGLLIVVGVLTYGVQAAAERFPRVDLFIKRKPPKWSSFASTFRQSRRVINFIVLVYFLFYLSQGIDEQAPWAIWVNEHIFHFFLFGREFKATDVIRIELLGYAIYLVLELLYNYYCPQVLQHSIRDRGVLRPDTGLILLETIERHGQKTTGEELSRTLKSFVETYRSSFPEVTREQLQQRLKTLEDNARASVGQSSLAILGFAATVARFFSQSLTTAIYYTGKDLFDTLYPAIRLALRAGLVIALVATSLPVLAKVITVVLPRTGERPMTYIEKVPPGFRDFEWVPFAGVVVQETAEQVVLRAAEDQGQWFVSRGDVEVLPDHKGENLIFLRRDGLVNHMAREARAAISTQADAVRRTHPNCPVNTMCSNNILLCCLGPPHKILGSCNGRWDCED